MVGSVFGKHESGKGPHGGSERNLSYPSPPRKGPFLRIQLLDVVPRTIPLKKFREYAHKHAKRIETHRLPKPLSSSKHPEPGCGALLCSLWPWLFFLSPQRPWRAAACQALSIPSCHIVEDTHLEHLPVNKFSLTPRRIPVERKASADKSRVDLDMVASEKSGSEAKSGGWGV